MEVHCYPFDDKGTDAAFEMVRTYFEKIGMKTSFDFFVGEYINKKKEYHYNCADGLHN